MDESGDFGPFRLHSPYYIVTMVFHEQKNDLVKQIQHLDKDLEYMGYAEHVVHTEPLIRREEDYKYLSPNERRTIFLKLYYFFQKCDLMFKTFTFRKKEVGDAVKLGERITEELSRFIRNHFDFFQNYDKVILYYDNGQQELSRILNLVLKKEVSNYEMRRVFPCNYKLFQVADLLCTLELMRIKIEEGKFSKLEQLVFHSKSDLKKDFLKGLKKKEFSG